MQTSSFLSALSDDERTRLLMGAERHRYAAGDVLLREGDSGSSLFILEAGEVRVTRAGAELAGLAAGDVIGDMALLDPAPRSATVIARGVVEAIELDRVTVWALLAEGDPAAIKTLQSITATVCQRLAAVNAQVQDEVVRPAEANVFKRLFSSVFGRK